MHLGAKQVMDLWRYEIDLPFSARVYKDAYLGLGNFTIVFGVSIWLEGILANIENITLHHNGLLSLKDGGHTEHLPSSEYEFIFVRIQDNSTIETITDPATQPGILFTVHQSMFIEGGGTFHGTNTTITAYNFTIDDGGTLMADALGFRPTDAITQDINIGRGHDSSQGSSGGGHGGTSGWGGNTDMTGQPYGHLYQPYAFGSSGGGAKGGRGGGLLWLNVFNLIEIDGEIRADGGDGGDLSSGGKL